MGEKIRDIKEITLCGSKLMVELNKGYKKNDGDVFHIQNDKFRYLIKEKDFLKFAGLVLRAESEFDYLKGKEN